jgi:hypothetical protein
MSPERPQLAQTAQQQPSNANSDSPTLLRPQSPAAFQGPRQTGANAATGQPGSAALSAADGAASAANGRSSSTSFFQRSGGGRSQRASALLLHRRPSSSPGRRPFLTASVFFRPADDHRDSLAEEVAGGAVSRNRGPRTILDG